MDLNLRQKKILKLLSINCRFTNKDIAKSVGISEDSVAYQIDKLINEKKLGLFNVQFFFPMIDYDSYHVWLRLDEKAILELKKIDEIHSINKSNGKFDCQLLIFAKSFNQFKKILERIKNLVVVEELKYAKLIDNYKNFSNITPEIDVPVKIPQNKKKFEYSLNDVQYKKPNNYKKIKLDKIDKQIVKYLMENPRASFQKISQTTNINHETIRYRLKKFVKENFIMNFGLIRDFSKFNTYSNYFLLNINEENIKPFIQFINSSTNIFYCAKLEGDYNCIIYVASSNPLELGNINTSIRKTLGKALNEIDMLFFGEIIKYEQFPKEILKNNK